MAAPLHRVFGRVWRAGGRPTVTLQIIDSEVVNALTDGRTIVVSTGLVERCTEAQLGGVIAHEMAHVVMGHVGRQRRAHDDLAAQAPQEVGADGIEGIFARLVIAAGVEVASARLSRRFESDADAVGELIARVAGYEGGLASFLQSFGDDSSEAGVFDSHPLILRRIRALGELRCSRR
jgi:Zn-dependent protease with chaperone function